MISLFHLPKSINGIRGVSKQSWIELGILAGAGELITLPSSKTALVDGKWEKRSESEALPGVQWILGDRGALLMCCGSLEKTESWGLNLFQPFENPEEKEREPQTLSM